MKKFVLAIFMFVLTAPFVYAAGGTHWDPFDGSWSAPAGTHAALVYYKYDSANKWMKDGDVQSSEVSYDYRVTVARWNTWQQIGSIPFQLSVIVPLVNIDTPLGKVSGMGDPGLVSQFRLTAWEGGYMNAGMSVYFPIGKYNLNRPSPGMNRWAFRPSFILSQTVSRFRVDWISAVEFYTDNSAPAATIEKDMEFFTDLHLSYMLDPSSNTYVALSFGGTWLGEEKAGGAVVNSDKADYVGRLSLGTNFSPTTSIIFSVHHDIRVENGAEGWGGQIRFAKAF